MEASSEDVAEDVAGGNHVQIVWARVPTAWWLRYQRTYGKSSTSGYSLPDFFLKISAPQFSGFQYVGPI